MDQKFFITPFANAGDKAVVPDGAQPSGVVSYDTGWGFDYQRTLGTDPSAKPVDRASTNQLMYDVTSSLGALQRKAFPEFITAANNNAVPFPYEAGVVVMFNTGSTFVPYVSLVDNNTAVPGTDAAKWQLFLFAESTNAQAVAATDDTTVMTPRRVGAAIAALGAAVPDATTAVAGKTRYATTAEANAITVTNAAVTPSALGNFVQKTGAQMTGSLDFRGSPNRIRLYDNNNDVVCVEVYTGVGSATDRHGGIINRNAGGFLQFNAGNGVGTSLTLRVSDWTMAGTGTITGNLTVSNQLTVGQIVQSSTAALVLCPTAPGTLYFRPNGAGSSANECTVASDGRLTVNGPITGNGTCTAAGGFQNTSSHKVKNFSGLIEYTLDDLLRIETHVGSFKPEYLDEDGRAHLFFDAEQFASVVREPVIEGVGKFNDEDIPGMDPSQVCVLLTKLLQDEVLARRELQARFEQLLAEREG